MLQSLYPFEQLWALTQFKAAAIRTTQGKRPVYISQGFGISLKRTIEEYRRWAIREKVPEPLKLAHLHAKKQFSKGEKVYG